MFSEQAWNEGWAVAQSRGRANVTRKDVEAIVSAVANYGFQELYAGQVLPDGIAESMVADAMESLRKHMRRSLAVEAIENDCVMLTLPREIIDHPERGMTRIRLIVPVRRLESH